MWAYGLEVEGALSGREHQQQAQQVVVIHSPVGQHLDNKTEYLDL